MKKDVKIVLCGLGGVGRAFIESIKDRKGLVEDEYGISLILKAAVDIGGAAIAPPKDGIDPGALLNHLSKGSPVETFAHGGRPGLSGERVLFETDADVLVEATPTNLIDGEPGTTHIVTALKQKMDVVSANKGPLVLYYGKLHELAEANGCALHISAATAAALPTLDVGSICLAGTRLISAEGILNGTTNYILTRMQHQGCDYEAALKEAQEMGIAETDPTYDVEGKDTANKIILIANRLFKTDFGPADIKIQGITGITQEDIGKAADENRIIKLIGTVEREDDAVRIGVAPKLLERDHPLASVYGSEKAVSYLTDSMDRITVMGGKSSTAGAAAALLKDLINAFA